MTYSVEFIVQTEQFQHVQLTIDGQDFVDNFIGKDTPMEELLGDYWASLKAGVLYGRDQALKGVADKVGTFDMPTREEFEAQVDAIAAAKGVQDDPEAVHKGAVEALIGELGATVLSEEEKSSGAPSSPSTEDPKPKRPWDKKPAATGPEAVARKAALKDARKAAAPKTETKSDWDF